MKSNPVQQILVGINPLTSQPTAKRPAAESVEEASPVSKRISFAITPDKSNGVLVGRKKMVG